MIFCSILQSYDVETSYGTVHVAMQGDKTKPAIFTYHDIGLNRMYIILPVFKIRDLFKVLCPPSKKSGYIVLHVSVGPSSEKLFELIYLLKLQKFVLGTDFARYFIFINF